MNTVTCISCTHWSPRKVSAERARADLGICELFSQGPWQMHSGAYQRECGKHSPAAPEIVAARIKFQEQRKDNP